MIKKGATHENPTPWIHGVMQIFALFMFLGMLTSLLVPESKGMRLEELAGEKEDVYELQFRSGFFTRKERGSGSTRASVRGGGERGRGTGRGGHDVQRGRWWKL
jgi:PHS family inorganic phosphate transporter-like MFS transporter